MPSETSPETLKSELDDLYVQAKPMDKRKPFLWFIFLVSLFLIIGTFTEPSNRYEIRRAVGVIGFGVLWLAPVVTSIWLVADHLKARKIWNQIFALQKRLGSMGWSYMSAWELSESKLLPRK